ncbi:GntR family transcriptional regulator [Nocardiopsis sediminis]|uniref:GntR family transcriptional regulator n=1 Tax=Nocardiopsis sediminis TaxID=1778267 RepID=A0ABV8FVI5_9ACTN
MMAEATSKTEGVYRLLKSEIENLTLRPGTRLSEVVVADRIGASRTPVREAIRRLAREGLVRFTPGEVAQVAPVSLGGVRTLFEFRMVLEPAAIAMITRDGAAAPELIEPFRDLLGGFERVEARLPGAGRDALAADFSALTERFDQALIAATHNEPLAKTIADQQGQMVRLRRIARTDPDQFATSLREHLRMCRAVLDGDPGAAADEVTRHLDRALHTILNALARDAALPAAVDVHI